MTDNEIIKALECCSKEDYNFDCENCPYHEQCKNNENIFPLVLDLINRQKAEIERLKAKILEEDKLLNVRISEAVNAVSKADQRYIDAIESRLNDTSVQLKVTKIETIKEFAEKLKEKAYPFPCAIGVEYAVPIRAINDLVKEMAGDNNAE